MGQAEKFEPTLMALRKKAAEDVDAGRNGVIAGTLYEHLFGYDPIRVAANSFVSAQHDDFVRRNAAQNPSPQILNPITNFAVMEMASELPPENN